MNCIGRSDILRGFDRQYRSGRFEMSVIHGPHRVGKSYIGTQLVKAYNALYLYGRLGNEAVHGAALKRGLRSFDISSAADKAISGVKDILHGLFEASLEERIMLVIDDYPALVESVPKFPIWLRDLSETYHSESQLFVVIIGSTMAQLNGRIIGEKSLIDPFITARYEVLPFTAIELADMGFSYESADQNLLMAVTGGYAHYVALFDPHQSMRHNLKRLFFHRLAPLVREPYTVLSRGIKNIGAAHAILYALAW